MRASSLHMADLYACVTSFICLSLRGSSGARAQSGQTVEVEVVTLGPRLRTGLRIWILSTNCRAKRFLLLLTVSWHRYRKLAPAISLKGEQTFQNKAENLRRY